MAERLVSVGLDVGTTSTQMIVSELEIENRAAGFAVPELEIAGRRILYKSPVHFTPLLNEELVDGAALRTLVETEYAAAGLDRSRVDTGAVIITGETSRKENARAVLHALSELAGDFVVATAGPELESVLAARGSGAVEFSEKTGKTVLHMDIGGGTANLALIRAGEIVSAGCLNVGGRLIKFDKHRTVTYVSPVLGGLCSLKPGDTATPGALEQVAEKLAEALEMAAGRRPGGPLLERLTTPGTAMEPPSEPVVVSFSGGVADCVETPRGLDAFGDMGPTLGRAIRESLLCRGEYRLGQETIRATVIGAGCHSAQLSGSTVFCSGVALPVKNCPAVCLTEREQLGPGLAERIKRLAAGQDRDVVLALPGLAAPHYSEILELAAAVAEGMAGQPVMVAVERDMAKALGQAIALKLEPGRGCLCIDGVRLAPGSYLDVGAPVGPAMPVVVKTLILSH